MGHELFQKSKPADQVMNGVFGKTNKVIHKDKNLLSYGFANK